MLSSADDFFLSETNSEMAGTQQYSAEATLKTNALVTVFIPLRNTKDASCIS